MQQGPAPAAGAQAGRTRGVRLQGSRRRRRCSSHYVRRIYAKAARACGRGGRGGRGGAHRNGGGLADEAATTAVAVPTPTPTHRGRGCHPPRRWAQEPPEEGRSLRVPRPLRHCREPPPSPVFLPHTRPPLPPPASPVSTPPNHPAAASSHPPPLPASVCPGWSTGTLFVRRRHPLNKASSTWAPPLPAEGDQINMPLHTPCRANTASSASFPGCAFPSECDDGENSHWGVAGRARSAKAATRAPRRLREGARARACVGWLPRCGACGWAALPPPLAPSPPPCSLPPITPTYSPRTDGTDSGCAGHTTAAEDRIGSDLCPYTPSVSHPCASSSLQHR